MENLCGATFRWKAKEYVVLRICHFFKKSIHFFSLTLQGLSLMTEVNYIKTHFQKQFMNRKLYLKSLRNALNGN